MPLFDPSPPKVLTIQQPWAHLIVSGRKTIENRTWKTEYRGALYIHAGKRMHKMPASEIARIFKIEIDPACLIFGAIIGRVRLVDIVTRSDSPWFFGPYGLVLENPELITPIALRGQQTLFDLPVHLTPQLSTR